jgi:membrane-associated protease RseP (regulator of RpoE activity)
MKNFFLFVFVFTSFQLLAHNADDAVLGIKSGHIAKDKAKKLGLEMPYGSRVSEIYPASPAEEIGLQVLDYIYGINGEWVDKENSLSDLLDNHAAGDEVEVYFERDGQKKTAMATLVRRGDLKRTHTPDSEDPFLGIYQNHNKKANKVEGIRVDIVHNSTAEALGLQDGDIISAIDDYPVFDWHDTEALINNRQVGEPIAVTYYRDGRYYDVERPIKSQEATHNDHSRPNGPEIIEAEASDENYVASVEITEPEIQEVEALIASNDEEEEEQQEDEDGDDEQEILPGISGLQVKQLNIFPNPSTGIFDIQFTLSERGETMVYIYNPSGQAVYFNNLGEFAGTFSDRIDIENGVRGIYFLQLRQGQNIITRKIVLQ